MGQPTHLALGESCLPNFVLSNYSGCIAHHPHFPIRTVTSRLSDGPYDSPLMFMPYIIPSLEVWVGHVTCF